jgi:hypothetical protein
VFGGVLNNATYSAAVVSGDVGNTGSGRTSSVFSGNNNNATSVNAVASGGYRDIFLNFVGVWILHR